MSESQQADPLPASHSPGTSGWWQNEIKAVPAAPPIKAVLYIRSFGTYSGAAEVRCDDGHDYVIKGVPLNRPSCPDLVTERAAALLGRSLAAPVPDIALVDINDLRALEPNLQRFEAKLAHGSKSIANVRDQKPPQPNANTSTRNKAAYAALAVLWGWFQSADEQWLITVDSAEDVYESDHGHFLPGGPNWGPGTLGTAMVPQVHPTLAPFTNQADVDAALAHLASVTDSAIARAVAHSDDWNVDLVSRSALAQYLAGRRDSLLNP